MTGTLVSSPVFLVGAERSGTTLLRLMLSGHPEIDWANEFEFVVDFVSPEGSWPDLASYHERLSTHRVFQSGPYQIDPSLSYPELVSSFLEQRITGPSTRILGATVHRHYDRLLRLWPDARFIHLCRDPRDVASSCVGMGWAGNVWTGVERWIEAERLWTAVRSALPPDRVIEQRYEALIEDAEASLQRLCRWLGVSYDPGMLEYPSSTTYSSPDPALTQQWKKKLAPREIRWVETRVGPLLGERGYSESGLAPLHVGRAMALLLRLQDRMERARFRLRIFGWRLRLEELAARISGNEAWRRNVILRMNAIIQARAK